MIGRRIRRQGSIAAVLVGDERTSLAEMSRLTGLPATDMRAAAASATPTGAAPSIAATIMVVGAGIVMAAAADRRRRRRTG